MIAGQIAFNCKRGRNAEKENAQSNFGCIGNSFTRDDGDGQIAVFMDDEEYHVFRKYDNKQHRNNSDPVINTTLSSRHRLSSSAIRVK